MLLIGSRAAKSHLPDFREPLDWDFIATEPELALFSGLEPVGRQGGPKRGFRFGRTYVEVEMAFDGTSAQSLYGEADGEAETPFGSVRLASVDALFLLKRSHIGFPHMWSKHFKDYRVLQDAVGCVPSRLEPTFNLRVEETKRRLRYRDHDFSVSNDEFFARSASKVPRAVVHDDIHETVKFGDTPVFKTIKPDLGRAEVSYAMFCELPFRLKLQNLQEECMVLTLERHAIPARIAGRPFRERASLELVLKAMCFNYLPFDFRLFCVDYFRDVLAGVPRGYSERAMDALGIVPVSSTRGGEAAAGGGRGP